MTIREIIDRDEREIRYRAQRIGSIPGLVDWFTVRYMDDLDNDECFTSRIHDALLPFFTHNQVTL